MTSRLRAANLDPNALAGDGPHAISGSEGHDPSTEIVTQSSPAEDRPPGRQRRTDLDGPENDTTKAGSSRLVPIVVLLGIMATGAAWFGLRAVESSQAEVNYERRLLGQSSDLQSEVEAFANAFEGLRAFLDFGDNASGEQMNRFLTSVDLDEQRLIFVGSPTGDDTREIVRTTGFDDNERLVGTKVEDIEVLRRAVFDATLVGDTIALDDPAIDSLFAEDVPGSEDSAPAQDPAAGDTPSPVQALSFAAPVGIDAEDTGVILGQMSLAPVFERMAADTGSSVLAIELRLDDQVLAASLPQDELGDPFGDPVVFTNEGNLWSIQGFESGLEVSNRFSTAALVLGAMLSAMAGFAARATRRHAITLGRLERSEHDARHDDLTGLLNRSGLTQSLSHALTERSGNDLVGVLFLDLDRLKVVNDSIGHSAGDEVLIVVAERLRAIVRDSDIIGRFGGDEFVVVSPGTPAISDLTALAERVLESLKEPAVLSDESSQMISASIGISYVAKGEASAENMLRDADVAMYQAKDRGGSCYAVFDAELREQAVARLEVERELRRAIRTGQLVVHYQPIVDVASGQVDRLEALVRWQHPERGMIPPGAFLAVAAESGLIVDVGEHVLRESCRQVAQWSAALGRDVMVSVNVAERQLMDSSLTDTVRRVLAETGIKASQLELEITEELIVDKLDHRLQVLHDLVGMGIKLAIDDFGTSRASLSQLKKLDMVSTLKIDRAFVIDVATDVVDRKIVTAIVALADSVGMEVVAEGIEEAEQAGVLRHLGVDLLQGFYFQRPAPSNKMTTLFTRAFDVPDAQDLDASL